MTGLQRVELADEVEAKMKIAMSIRQLRMWRENLKPYRSCRSCRENSLTFRKNENFRQNFRENENFSKNFRNFS
jgi:hypothetical protein